MRPSRLALAITLALLAGPAGSLAWAQPALPLPSQLPAGQRAKIDDLVKHAFAWTKAEAEPYPVRPDEIGRAHV